MERFTLDATARIGCRVEVTLADGRVTRARLTRANEPDTPLSPAGHLVRTRLARHLETGREDLGAIPVALEGLPPFQRRVLETLHERVGAGEVVTYGELAALAGNPGASRAVGGAMHANPIPLIVPCHRVVASNGLGNYSGVGSTETKRRLLELENAPGYGARGQTRLLHSHSGSRSEDRRT